MSKCMCGKTEIKINGFFRDSEGDYTSLNNVTTMVWHEDDGLSVKHFGGDSIKLEACDGKAFLEAFERWRSQ